MQCSDQTLSEGRESPRFLLPDQQPPDPILKPTFQPPLGAKGVAVGLFCWQPGLLTDALTL